MGIICPVSTSSTGISPHGVGLASDAAERKLAFELGRTKYKFCLEHVVDLGQEGSIKHCARA